MPSFFRTSPGAESVALPTPLRAGAGLVAVQGLVGVVIGIAFMIGGVWGGPADTADAEIIGALTLVLGAGLLMAALGLVRGRRAARAPAFVWQLIMLGVGVSEFRDSPALAVPLVVIGGLTTAMLFHPAANEVLSD